MPAELFTFDRASWGDDEWAYRRWVEARERWVEEGNVWPGGDDARSEQEHAVLNALPDEPWDPSAI